MNETMGPVGYFENEEFGYPKFAVGCDRSTMLCTLVSGLREAGSHGSDRAVGRAARRRFRTGPAATGVLIGALVLIGCGGSSSRNGGRDASDHLTVTLTLSDAGCAPSPQAISAGEVTFAVENSGRSRLTEARILDANGVLVGKHEWADAGLSRDFSLDMKPGQYTVECHGAKTERFPLVVTHRAGTGTDPKLAAATVKWKRFVDGNAAELLRRTRAFTAAVKAGDLQKARDSFAATRLCYERIEPVAESFANLDAAIDAHVSDVASGEEWTGFHRIERALFAADTTRGMAKYADKLLADVTKLRKEIPKLGYRGSQIASGALELLNEAARSKITGEEDRYSHTDLSDLAGNLDGSKAAFAALEPVLVDRRQRTLATTINSRFAAVEKTLDKYRRSSEASGWASYHTLTKADRRTLTQAIDALAEPLSTVASQVSP